MGHLWILAAAAQAAAPAVLPPTPDNGVIPYPPAFFAASAPKDAYDMVLRVPGFTFDKGAAVRGLAGASGNVLIDGQPPVSKNDGLDEILKRIPAGSVERIELIRGGAPGIDMEGRTVLANVIRKKGGGFRGSVQVSGQYFYDGRVLPGMRAEGQWQFKNGARAELSQVYGAGAADEFGDGHRYRYNANGSVRLASKVDADSYGNKIWTTGAYETPLASGRLRINGAYMLTPATVEIYDNYTSANGVEYERDEIDKLQAELGGRYTRRLNQWVGLEVIALQQINDNKTTVNFQAPGLIRDFRLDKKSSESVARANLKIARSPMLAVEIGMEGAYNHLDSETTLVVNRAPVRVPAANVQVSETRGEVFARGTWRPNQTLSIEAGIRQEGSHVTSRGDVLLGKTLTYTKPRAALTWAPDPTLQVRARVEREVGQLNFDDFVASSNVASTGTVVAGNPDLTPQQAWVYEAAVERRFWGAGAAVLTARHFQITDVVDRVTIFSATGLPLADAPGNIGSGTKDEYAASLSIPLERFGVRSAQLRGQVLYRKSRVKDPLLPGHREISALHPVDWEAHYSQDLPQWRTTFGLDLFNAYRERFYRLNEIETRKFSPSLWLTAEYKPRRDIIIRFEAQGITARNARRIREVYIGPRSTGRLDYTDVRSLEWGGGYLVRVRKVLGG